MVGQLYCQHGVVAEDGKAFRMIGSDALTPGLAVQLIAQRPRAASTRARTLDVGTAPALVHACVQLGSPPGLIATLSP